MKNEIDMMNMLIDFANNDDRIRLVTLKGSRTNKNIPRDLFQDYDEAITGYTENIYSRRQ